jgi:hypothetical protein
MGDWIRALTVANRSEGKGVVVCIVSPRRGFVLAYGAFKAAASAAKAALC